MKLKKVPVRLIKEPDRPIRSRMVEERLEELAQSIGKSSRNAPIRLTPYVENGNEIYRMDDEEFNQWIEDYEGEWLLVDGHRRYVCRKRKKDQQLWARLDNVAPEEAGMERAKENIYREDVSAVEEGRYFEYLRSEHDILDKEIAEQIGKSPSYVTDRRNSLEWPEDIKDPLEYGDLDWSKARLLKNVDNETHRKRLIAQTVNMGATTETVRQWVNNYKRRKKQVEEMQEAAQKKKEAKTAEQHADAQDTAEQVNKKRQNLTTKCDLHRGPVPIENVVAIKVCDVCWHVLRRMRDDIHEHLERLDEELRYDKMEEEMEDGERQEADVEIKKLRKKHKQEG